MKNRWGIAAGCVVLLMLLILAGCAGQSTARAPNTPCYFEPGGVKFVCGSGGEIEVQSGGTVDVQSGATFTGALTGNVTGNVTGNATVGLFTATAGAVITATNGAPFTPTAMLQLLAAGGAVTPTITIPSAGKVVCLLNTPSNAITLADTSNQVLSGDAALGQYDVLCGYSDGTRFIQFAKSDN